jgi:hypothetical protein
MPVSIKLTPKPQVYRLLCSAGGVGGGGRWQLGPQEELFPKGTEYQWPGCARISCLWPLTFSPGP